MRKTILKQIDKYMDYCQNIRQMSKMTIITKKYIYKDFAMMSGCRDLRKLNNDHFNNWLKWQAAKGTVSNRTINTRVGHIVAMVRYYRDMGMVIPIKLSLVQKLKEGRVRRISYTREEVEYVLGGARELAWLLISIKFDTGIRITALTNLGLSNFNYTRMLFIDKGNKPREAYIRPETRERLQEYICKHETADKLWLNDQGSVYSVDNIRLIMKQAFNDAADRLEREIEKHGDPDGRLQTLVKKYRDFYPHSMRHSFATDLEVNGADPIAIRDMLGHSDVSTTQRYMHGFEGQLANLFAQYHHASDEAVRQAASPTR